MWVAVLALTAAAADLTAAVPLDGPTSFDGFDAVRAALSNDIQRRVFPGCVALVGLTNGTVLFHEAFGNLVYMTDPDPPAGPNMPVALSSRFDLASLTKVIATTTAVMQLYQRGLLGLSTPIHSILGSRFATHGKEAITVRNLLLHNAGLPPDPVPNYWDPSFGCPQTLHRPGKLTIPVFSINMREHMRNHPLVAVIFLLKSPEIWCNQGRWRILAAKSGSMRRCLRRL